MYLQDFHIVQNPYLQIEYLSDHNTVNIISETIISKNQFKNKIILKITTTHGLNIKQTCTICK